MTSGEVVVEGRRRLRSVEAAVSLPGEAPAVVRWSCRDRGLADDDDFLLPLALLPAMRIGARLVIRGAVSASLLERVETIQRVYWEWDRSLALVDVESGVRADVGAGPSGSAAFFSGGVDSFSAALSHVEDLAALVFVHGFDISIERTLLLARTSTALHLAGDELGTPVLDVETDIRQFSSGLLTWSEYHGAALAATALLLGSAFPTVFVPGSLSWDCVHPYGSHPALDPLFSTRAVGIVYDGFDHNRAAKTRAICASATALRWLRVCNSRDDFGYNCGRCEKCLRTMIGLRIAGQRLPLPSFPFDLDLSAVASRTVLRQRDLWEQNLDAAVRAGTDLPLIAALRASLSLHRSDMAPQ